jgi:hypothetical protein
MAALKQGAPPQANALRLKISAYLAETPGFPAAIPCFE